MVAFFSPPFFLGSSRSVTQLYASSVADTSFSSVPLGPEDPRRRILVLGWHGQTGGFSDSVHSCSIGATAMTDVERHTTGSGSFPNTAIGTIMWIGNPSGTSATVSVNWGGQNLSIVVLGLIGYSDTPTDHNGEAATGSDGTVSVTTASNGCVVFMGGRGNTQTTQSWTGITKRGQDNVVFSGGSPTPSRSWAWDINTDGVSHNYTVSPWSSSQGNAAMQGVTFPVL